MPHPFVLATFAFCFALTGFADTSCLAEDKSQSINGRQPPSAADPTTSGSVVWLDGTIDEPRGYAAGRLLAENDTTTDAPYFTEQLDAGQRNSSVSPIPVHSSFDTTRLAGYDGRSDDLSEAMDAIESPPGSLPSQAPCTDSAICEPAPWISWKKTKASTTWLAGGGGDIGQLDLSIGGTLGFKKVPFIFVTPNYEATFLEAPANRDVPDVLHRASVAIMGMMPLSERFMGQVIVSPGISTDFENTSSDAMRTTGVGMVIFRQSPELQWMFGVVYLDREDISILPAVGLNWSPNERTKLEFTFPRPRFKRRMADDGFNERWWYLAAEFGGGSWAVERANGTDDIITLKDYRLLFGIETTGQENRSWFWEAGLVLGREVEYDSDIGNFNQDPTIMLRGGINF
ncbi:MAG: DUF6268 family outer membrane beta-barrel protein [Rubinisphaera brasiliensis]|uniref:DUF6268 family outer membrane beta-barrel protein n=1 Tax=Rubinisphaera brasiliensis TaxID=119 RepID=UPI00391CD247